MVDPIDGTTNYVRGSEGWMVSIGLTYQGKPIAGVTYQPELDKLYFAESGKGAFLQRGNKVPIKLDQRDKTPIAYVFDILTNRPLYMETAALHQMLRDDIRERTEGEHIPRYRTMGCPSVPMCQMAEGAYAGVINWPINFYDVAASMVIAEEAGMKMRFEKAADGTEQIVATTPELFESTCHAFDVTLGKHAHFYPGCAEDGVVERMKEDGIKYGVSVGRRQPMHKMHMDCIQEMADAGLKPIVVIGSANNGKNALFNPLENPLNEAQQREQIAQAMQKASIDDYEILSLPDMGNMEEWAASVRHLLKANGIDPTKAVCHYRAKEDTAKDSVKLVKPMKSSNEALMRYGMSVWESYNAEPEKMDGISATAFRSMDLFDTANQSIIDTTLVAPDFVREQAQAARFANPDKGLLNVPITMLDLTLNRLCDERGLTTADILQGERVLSVDSLTEALKAAIRKPSAQVSGELQAISGQSRNRV